MGHLEVNGALALFVSWLDERMMLLDWVQGLGVSTVSAPDPFRVLPSDPAPVEKEYPSGRIAMVNNLQPLESPNLNLQRNHTPITPWKFESSTSNWTRSHSHYWRCLVITADPASLSVLTTSGPSLCKPDTL